MSYKFYYGNISLSKLYLPRNNWDGAKSILAVLKSIKRVGLKKPFIVKKNYNEFEILLGGARYWALRKLKYKTAPCVIISDKKIQEYKKIKNYEELLKIAKVKNCNYINTYKRLLKIAKVKKLWYLEDRLYYEG